MTGVNSICDPVASIIIPTLNEEKAIKDTIYRIPKPLRARCQILVVDGLSTDATIEEAKRAGAEIVIVDKPGKGYAMRYGAKCAQGEALIFLDGDGTYPSEAIPDFLRSVRDGVLVLGNATPYIKNRPTIVGKLQYLYPSFWLTRFVFSRYGIFLQDPLSGMRAIMKRDFRRLNLAATGFEIETEMNIKAINAGMKLLEIPITISRRDGNGKSKFFFNFRSHLKILGLLRSYKNNN